jgi:hypothetical protein
MAKEITEEVLLSFRGRLEEHPVYEAVETVADLRCFMEHHVYSVWDFMSLIKYLQSIVAPTRVPWVPQGDAAVRRFINELVLEEESDETNEAGQYSSHFELYRRAMAEIGADTAPVSEFIRLVEEKGIDAALESSPIPEPARAFTATTFGIIRANRPQEVAAALALGREHIIPCMFRSILQRIGVSERQAPIFHFYLKRHIHLDEDFHAPLSLRLLNRLCGDSEEKLAQAVGAARAAVEARIAFWDGVREAIETARGLAA